MPIDWIGDRDHLSILPDLRIQVGDELVTEHVEINPCIGAPALGETHPATIKISCLIDVAYLDGQMEWSQFHLIVSTNH